jgi:thiamine kinase-like enzyme
VKATLLSLNSPVVLSHNDLLHANIMMLEDGSLQLIDFEYGGTNYRGFDLGVLENNLEVLTVYIVAWIPVLLHQQLKVVP